MFDFLRGYWKCHGTKILGAIIFAAGAILTVAGDIILLAPPWLRPYEHIGFGILGYCVLRRGFTNDNTPSR
jgi:hypothetical protein